MKDFSLVRQVSRRELERIVSQLSLGYPTRHTLSRSNAIAGNYLLGTLWGLGYKTSRHAFKFGGKDCFNVIGDETPSNPRSTVIFGAHFDSRQENIGLPDAKAPGADDNATGVAALIEVARLWKKYPGPKRDRVVFALFSGEEQGLVGSTAYAAVSQKPATRFMFNLDQIGYPPQKGPKYLFLDIDEAGRKDNNAESARLIARLEDLAKNVVKVPTKRDPAEGSDYMPFESRGVPIVGLYEGEYRYPHYHKSTDAYDKVDFGYVTDMTRLTLAFLIDQCAG